MSELNMPQLVTAFLDDNADSISYTVRKHNSSPETIQTILTDLHSYHIPEFNCDTAQRQILQNCLDYESVENYIKTVITPQKMRYDWKSKEKAIYSKLKRGDGNLTIAKGFGFPDKAAAALTSYLGKWGGRSGFIEYYSEKMIEENVPVKTVEIESKERRAEKLYGVLLEHHINDEKKLAELRVLAMKLAAV